MTQSLTPHDVTAALAAAGVPLIRSVLAYSVPDVGKAYDELGAARVALKASGLLHKTDAGGVVLGLGSREEVVAAASDLHARIGDEALPFTLQQMASGLEILVGATRDPQLGAAIVVGLGGVLAEVHQDSVMAIAPVDREQALEMLRGLRSWSLLEGYRGEAPRDVDALADVVVAASRFIAERGDVAELDLNPVMVGAKGEGVVVVDARVITGEFPDLSTRPRLDLTRMLNPRHIAVIGVSDDVDKVGARLFRYIDEHGFDGTLSPVHPSGGTVRGYDRARTLADVEGSPDLVCITVPSRFVLDIARQAVDKQVGGVIVHSSDFAETGAEGRELQDELTALLEGAGIPFAGPNCMGLLAPHQGLTASISGGMEKDLVAGNVAVVSSSGALGSCLGTRILKDNAGLSFWAHGGNEASLQLSDYLRYLVTHDDTRAVGLLVEDIKDAGAFREAGCALAAAGKPAFAYNMVRSSKGKEAALSHTGAMVGSFAQREAVLEASHVVSVPSLRVLEDALLLCANYEQNPRGRRLAAITFSGGACSIIADEAERFGIELPELSEQTQATVKPYVPSFAAVRNPLDCSFAMLTRAAEFERVIEVFGNSGEFDAVLVQFTTNADPYAVDIARAVVAVKERLPIPLYVSRYGGEQLAPNALAVYAEAGVLVMDAPDRATAAVAAVMQGYEAVRAAGRHA